MAIKNLKSAEKTRGVTYVEAGFSDIFGYDRAGSDDRAIADHDWEYGCIGPDAHAIAKPGLVPEAPFPRRSSHNEWIINKHRAVRNETIIPNRNELADK
jgi:hypothetical protein